jgi:tRNA (adenine22-N1)-methyltransferase
MCNKTRVIADVGADHGYTCAGILQRGLAEKVIATDISEKSLEKAKRLFAAMDMQENTECRAGD